MTKTWILGTIGDESTQKRRYKLRNQYMIHSGVNTAIRGIEPKMLNVRANGGAKRRAIKIRRKMKLTKSQKFRTPTSRKSRESQSSDNARRAQSKELRIESIKRFRRVM